MVPSGYGQSPNDRSPHWKQACSSFATFAHGRVVECIPSASGNTIQRNHTDGYYEANAGLRSSGGDNCAVQLRNIPNSFLSIFLLLGHLARGGGLERYSDLFAAVFAGSYTFLAS